MKRSGERRSAQEVENRVDLLVALPHQPIDREVALMPGLGLIRTDPCNLVEDPLAKALERGRARRLECLPVSRRDVVVHPAGLACGRPF
jgi:hypothetical protein